MYPLSTLLNQCLITRMTSSANYCPSTPPHRTPPPRPTSSPVNSFHGVLPAQVVYSGNDRLFKAIHCQLELCYTSVLFWPVNYCNHSIQLEDTIHCLFVLVQINQPVCAGSVRCQLKTWWSLTGCLLEFIFTQETD